MTRYREADLGAVHPQPVEERPSRVTVAQFATPVTPDMAAVLDALPDLLAGADLRRAVDAVAASARAGRPVVAMIGAHVVKTGCGPLIVQLLREGVVTAVAMNGATAIHDYEVARFGKTSEDVAASLQSRTFGMSEETSTGMNRITREAADREEGLGEALGRSLLEDEAPHAAVSVLAEAYRLERPATVHVALGTDILHQHPSADGAAIGETSLRDFRILAAALRDFRGGTALNIGSAVILPEVFLKAFSVAGHLGADLTGITTIDFDFIRHYRPRVNVVQRPTGDGRGVGYEITGHHEILLPLFTAGVLRALH
jgi:hypothetical protein